ncbi:MAG: tRNA (adenosine(37)-N6)-threonylcarbamoyltransferase complex transferase subunit TsaD [Mycoplasmatales bacterium]
MRDIYILAIESSCDETSIAIVKNGVEVVAQVTNTQIKAFEDLGGVVPEMASRMHADNIFYVYEQVLQEAKISIEQIDALAVTQGPGLIGSLIVGVNFVKTLCLIHKKPLIAVNHMKAHIYAIKLEEKIKFPHLSLIISGGHTELIYLTKNLEFKKIGQTLDDAVGESYDKVARLLKLSYPGGPIIDNLAKLGEDTYQLPVPKDDKTLDFSFSGLKSACFNTINTNKMKGIMINQENFSTSFQNIIVKILLKKFDLACQKYPAQQYSIVGGVSANSQIREEFNKKYPNLIIPSLKYTTDNGAMIGAIAYEQYLQNDFVQDIINFDANPALEID